MALWFWQLSADVTDGMRSEAVNVNFGGPQNIFVSCALSKYNGNGGSPKADFFISGWVQNGEKKANQHVYVLDVTASARSSWSSRSATPRQWD